MKAELNEALRLVLDRSNRLDDVEAQNANLRREIDGLRWELAKRDKEWRTSTEYRRITIYRERAYQAEESSQMIAAAAADLVDALAKRHAVIDGQLRSEDAAHLLDAVRIWFECTPATGTLPGAEELYVRIVSMAEER